MITLAVISLAVAVLAGLYLVVEFLAEAVELLVFDNWRRDEQRREADAQWWFRASLYSPCLVERIVAGQILKGGS